MRQSEARSRLTRLAVAFGLVVFLGGCASRPRTHVKTPSGLELQQTGETATAPRVDATHTTARTPLPAGSTVRIEPDGAVAVTVTAPAELTADVTRETATGAESFAPPSPAELARGFGVKLWGAAGLVLFVLALGLALRSHFKAAAIAGVGAVLVPIVGHFVNSTAGMVIAGVFVAAAVTLFVAWHLVRRRLEYAAPVVASAAIGQGATPAAAPEPGPRN